MRASDRGASGRGSFTRPAPAEAALEALRARPARGRAPARDARVPGGRDREAGLAPGEEEALRQEKARPGQRGPAGGAERRGLRAPLRRRGRGALAARPGLSSASRSWRDRPRVPAATSSPRRLRPPLEDLALFLRDYREGLQVSPGRLDEIESRLALIERLKRKYGASVEEVMAFGERCRRGARAIGSPEERESALVEAGRARPRATTSAARRKLSKQRRAAARDLEKRVQAELGAAGDGEDALQGAVRARTTPTADRRRLGLDRAGPGARPSSCSRPTRARSCGRWRGSRRAASCRGSCWR